MRVDLRSALVIKRLILTEIDTILRLPDYIQSD